MRIAQMEWGIARRALFALVCALFVPSALVADQPSAPAFTLRPGDVLANAPVGVSKTEPATVTRAVWSPQLGVSKPIPPVAPPSRAFYGGAVGVHRGPAVISLSPNRLAIGQSQQTVVVAGIGLQNVVTVSVAPAADVQITGFTAAPNGESLSVILDVQTDAQPGARRLVLRNAAGQILANLTPNANAVLLAANAPRMDSVSPYLLARGRVHSLMIRGSNLRGLPIGGRFSEIPRVEIEPSQGLQIGSTIVANDSGTEVRFSVEVTASAATTPRGVRVITESGSTPAQATPSNTIEIVDGIVRPIEPVLSALVGVRRLASVTSTVTAYGAMVGVSKGPVLTALQPDFAAPGTTTRLRLVGSGLATVAAVTFLPDTDIVVTPGSLSVSAAAIELEITVAANAALQRRRVTATGPGFSIQPPQLLEIRAQPPEVTALTPNYLLRDGSSQTIEIQGLRLSQTTTARALADDNLIIEQYQSISATRASMRLRTTGSATLGDRVLQVIGSNGTSSATANANNVFKIVDRATIATPLASALVGVRRPSAAPTRSADIYTPAVGVIRGGVITSVAPAQIAKGTTTRLTLRGTGLNSADVVTLITPDGISVQNLVAAADGSRIEFDLVIATDAALGFRRLLPTAAGQPLGFSPASGALVRIIDSQAAGPIANPDSYSARANDRLVVAAAQGVLTNDTNPLGGPMLAVVRRLPANGSLTLASDGGFIYTPNADYKGADRFEYSAASGPVVGASAIVSLDVEEPNDAVDDAYSTPDNLPLVVSAGNGLLANDVVTDGPVTITLLNAPQRGDLALNPDGSFRFTPNGSAGVERVRYRLLRNGIGSLPAEVAITVVDVNEPPQATDDTYSVDRGTTLVRSAPGLLANDRDPDGSAITARISTPPSVGALTLNPDGGFSYTPPASFVGSVAFDYEAVDPQGLADQGRVTITVNDNLAPQPDSYSFNEGEVLFVDAANGLLANDSVIANGTLQIVVTQQPTFGTVQVANDGSFAFRPDSPDRNGVATFRYQLRDSVVTSIVVPVTITVVAVNDAPITLPDSYLTDENAQLEVTAPGVLTNDRDVEGGVLRAEVAENPANGVVQLRDNGSFSYVPAVNFRGTDTFRYRAVDPQGGESLSTVTVRVTQPPTATNDVYLVDVNTPIEIADPVLGLLANDHDAPENDELVAILNEAPEHGSLTLNANGTFRYAPDPGYSGLDTFGYQVSDSRSISNIGTVTLAVGITSLPRALPDSYTMSEDQELIVPAAEGVLINDLDADTPRENLRPSVVSISDSGILASSLVLNPDGSFRVRMSANFFGPTFFVYQVFDGTSISNAAIVRLTVLPVNDGVEAVDDRFGVLRNTVFRSDSFSNIARNDRYDPDFPVNFALSQPPQFGQVELISSTGFFEYTPPRDFAGTDTFTYRVFQIGTGISDTAIVTLRTNGPPIAGADAYSLTEDSTQNVTPSILVNDSDPDGDVITLQRLNLSSGNGLFSMVVNSPTNPTISTATTSGHFYGTGSFGYEISDGTANAFGQITYTVAPVPDAPETASDQYLTQRNAALVVNAPQLGVLHNDFDPDTRRSPGAQPWAAATGLDLLPLSAELVVGPQNGTLTFVEVGTFSYVPNNNFSGVDRFTYRAVDATGRQSAITSVDIRVNSPAAAVDDAYVVNEDVVLSVASSEGVLRNDIDLDGDVLAAGIATNGCAPCNGRVVVRQNGSFTYTPNRDFYGQDEFFYSVSDPFAGNDVGRVSITVLPINDAPRTEPDTYRTREDEVLIAPQTLGILRNDAEVDGEQLENATLVQPPAFGVLSLSAQGGFSYTPQPNVNGRDTFRYRVFDSSGLSTDENVEVLITAVNDAPNAVNDAYEIGEALLLEVPASSGVLSNDSDVDGPRLIATVLAPPQRGTLTLAPDGSFSFRPDLNFSGIDRFQYQLDDGLGAVDSAVVVINVRPANATVQITTNDDFYAFDGPTLTVAAPGVLANDTVTGAPSLTATVAVAPTTGTLLLSPSGAFSYTAPEGFAGTVSFSYAARAGTASELALVTLDVRRVDNVPPIAIGEAFGVLEDGLLDSLSSGGLLTNDRDFEGAALVMQLQSPPLHGQLQWQPNGAFSYRPTPNFAGTDEFTYRVFDGELASNTVAAVITVFAQNDAPLAQNDAYSVAPGQPLNVNSTQGLLANDSDIDGDPLTVELVDSPLRGQVQANANGAFVYLPEAGFVGTDVFRYAATDQAARSVASVLIRVGQSGNRPPVAAGEQFAIDEDTALRSADVGLLTTNDIDPDGDPLSVILTTGPANGTLTLDGAAFSYQPNPNVFGPDRFSYSVSDGEFTVGPVVAEIVVRPVNDPPRAVADLFTVVQGQTLTVNAASGVLSNDSDVEGQALSAALQTAPSHGTVTVNADGSLVYRATATFSGRDEFSYRVSDGIASAIGRVAVDVSIAANRRPLAIGEAFVIPEDSVLDTRTLESLLANDVDPDGQPLTLRLLTQPGRGQLQTLIGGHIVYTPLRDDVGLVGFDYTVSDGELEAIPVRVAITLLPLNDPPVASADLYVLSPQASALNVQAAQGLLRNDVDPDGDQLVATLLQAPTAGTVALGLDGGFLYSPMPGPRPPIDRFLYRITDPSGRSSQAPVDISLNGQVPSSDVIFKSGFESPSP
jgi:large repetitive protein